MPRQIFLFSPVTSSTAEMLIKQLLDLDRENNDEITIFINSPGGSVTALFSIVDVMNVVKSKIRTVVIGQAASAAAVIAAVGDIRLITENSEFMLHEVFSFTMGTMSQLEEDVKRVDKMQTRLMNILSKATGKSVDKLESLTKKTNKFFDAKEAVRFGLADKVIKSNEAQLLKLSESINVEAYEIEYQKEGPSSVQLLREGKFYHPEYGDIVITEDILLKYKSNFDSRIRGIDISIDYTHDNEKGERPAACWIKKLELRDTEHGKGLFSRVEFTPAGEKLIQEKEYKYASADISIDYMTETGTHVPYVLRGGTLTNRPFIKEMNPIKLSEYNPTKEEIHKMNKEALIAALQGEGIDVVNLISSLETAQAEVETLRNKIKELNDLPAQKEEEIVALKKKLSETADSLAKNEKGKVWDSLVEAGKVLPATKDRNFETFKTSEELASFYKDAPVIVKIEKKGHDEEINEGELTEDEKVLVKNGTYSKEDIIKNRTVDGAVKKSS